MIPPSYQFRLSQLTVSVLLLSLVLGLDIRMFVSIDLAERLRLKVRFAVSCVLHIETYLHYYPR